MKISAKKWTIVLYSVVFMQKTYKINKLYDIVSVTG